jgi:hypothetical protein
VDGESSSKRRKLSWQIIIWSEEDKKVVVPYITMEWEVGIKEWLWILWRQLRWGWEYSSPVVCSIIRTSERIHDVTNVYVYIFIILVYLQSVQVHSVNWLKVVGECLAEGRSLALFCSYDTVRCPVWFEAHLYYKWIWQVKIFLVKRLFKKCNSQVQLTNTAYIYDSSHGKK